MKLIEPSSGRPVLTLDAQVEPFSKRLLWTRDSQCFAYFNDKGQSGTTTRVFFHNDNSFDEVAMIDLPTPALPPLASCYKTEPAETRTRIEPLQWTDSGDLVVEKELINNEWGRGCA